MPIDPLIRKPTFSRRGLLGFVTVFTQKWNMFILAQAKSRVKLDFV
jgi:hypothetical protein